MSHDGHQYLTLSLCSMIKKIAMPVCVAWFQCIDKYKNKAGLLCLLCCYVVGHTAYASTNHALSSAYSHPASLSWLQWQLIGKATLTWGFWPIYESELRSPSGKYIHNQPLALFITYQRSIKAEDLLDATIEQWQHLGFSQQQIERWRLDLINMWPDVTNGDCLIFVLQNNTGHFFFESQTSKLISLGQLQSPAAEAFMDIWLSARTSYPELRHKLIGKAS